MKVSLEISKQDMQYLYEVAENAEYTEKKSVDEAEAFLNTLKSKEELSVDDLYAAKARLRQALNRHFIALLFQNMVYDVLHGEG